MLTKAKIAAVRARLQRGWCQGAVAVAPFSFGVGTHSVAAKDPRACKWCLYGATVAEDLTDGDRWAMESMLREFLGSIRSPLWPFGHDLIPRFNDSKGTTLEKVGEFLDWAEERAA